MAGLGAQRSATPYCPGQKFRITEISFTKQRSIIAEVQHLVKEASAIIKAKQLARDQKEAQLQVVADNALAIKAKLRRKKWKTPDARQFTESQCQLIDDKLNRAVLLQQLDNYYKPGLFARLMLWYSSSS